MAMMRGRARTSGLLPFNSSDVSSAMEGPRITGGPGRAGTSATGSGGAAWAGSIRHSRWARRSAAGEGARWGCSVRGPRPKTVGEQGAEASEPAGLVPRWFPPRARAGAWRQWTLAQQAPQSGRRGGWVPTLGLEGKGLDRKPRRVLPRGLRRRCRRSDLSRAPLRSDSRSPGVPGRHLDHRE